MPAVSARPNSIAPVIWLNRCCFSDSKRKALVSDWIITEQACKFVMGYRCIAAANVSVSTRLDCFAESSL